MLIRQLQDCMPTLDERFGISKIALFGSYARDEANGESDVDLVILEAREKN